MKADMKVGTRVLGARWVLSALLVGHLIAVKAQMQDLGTLGGKLTYAADVSADGSVVVGRGTLASGQERAFRWTAVEGMQSIISTGKSSEATKVSADGSTVVGSWRTTSNQLRACVWQALAGAHDIGTLAFASQNSSWAVDVSGNGGVVVGNSGGADQDGALQMRAFRWTATEGMQNLGTLGGSRSEATAISKDGSTIVGFSELISGQVRAFKWTIAGGLQNLGTLGGSESRALAVSADGSTIVGYSRLISSGPYRAFRWTVLSGMQDIGDGFAKFVSADGSVVGIQKGKACIWTTSLGLQDLGTFEGGDYAAVLGLSNDGSTVVGEGRSGSGSIRPFRWTVTEGMQDLGAFLSVRSHATGVSADGSIVIGGSSIGEERSFRWGGDRDGDGLFDDWEVNGIDFDSDGLPEIDLKTLGANPDRKDIFVEVDSMSGYGPSPESMQMVIDAFDRAPVYGTRDEPGMRGIKLHILREGDQSLSTWDFVPTNFSSISGIFSPVQAYLSQINCVGTPAMRQHPLWDSKLRQAWLRVFRYCLFAKRILLPKEGGGTTWNTSGLANGFGSNYFLVTLGNDQGSGNWTDHFQTLWGQSRRTATVAGTFMHELGHTLGLKHGGSDHVNDKPNYFSVMNYVWQMPHPDYPVGWQLDYSRQPYNVLDENKLNEGAGIGGRSEALVPISTPRGRVLVREGGFVDFNANNASDGATVKANINGDKSAGADVFSTLSSQEDWSKLIYRSYGPGWEQDASYTSGEAFQPCLDYETYISLAKGAVNGTATLQGYTASTYGKTMTVEVWKEGAKVETQSVLVGESGRFAVSPASTGPVILRFQLLTGLVKSVPVTLGGTIDGLPVLLINGDCNGDNYVGSDDYLILNTAFDTSTGDTNFDSRADLNGDNYVGTDDYLILNQNFDREGD